MSISSYHRKRAENFRSSHRGLLDSALIPAKDNGEQKKGYCLQASLQKEAVQQGLQPQTVGPSMQQSLQCGDGTTAAALIHSGGNGSSAQWSQYMQENYKKSR